MSWLIVIYIGIFPFAYQYFRKAHEDDRQHHYGCDWTRADRNMAIFLSLFWPASVPIRWISTINWDKPVSW